MSKNPYTIGGALWLNFINTRHYSNGRLIDLLDDHVDFNNWLSENDLEYLSEKENILQLNKKILENLRDAFISLVNIYPSKNKMEYIYGLANLYNIFENIPVKFVFNPELDRGIRRIVSFNEKDQLIVLLIESFTSTYENYGLERIRQCSHETCILYFLDSSKGGKRRWCDMGVCGNRKKAANYRKKGSV